eukprot:CAMPEP_0116127968 /NCGR_PEP_ID=MMETSP0329-20121206/7114_1 /TAXON_ID=697910 /ORGANISM="Pseudo-nitzschia arenysensis, Strain B593" /LENGTH=254 /DNA_ID=CAMNT_0003622085 /DNA_START=37 /DNA_END=801 /DNA_ORIENTATION=+
MLESNEAVRRKGALAVYHALRVQITRFEDAFMQLNGRRPKGAIEKAPIATTYAQYREWKRFIRMDAARRIQALFRGARTRQQLQRKSQNYSQDSKLVEARATKRASGALPDDSNHSQLIGINVFSLDEIRAPAEVMNNDQDHNRSEYSHFPIHERDDPSTDSSQDSSQDDDSSLPITPTDDDSPIPDLPPLSLPELKARKQELKGLLKDYDMKFMIENGRMPNKSEKEPIRYLYDRYNALKDLIRRKTLIAPDN